jgi:predicted RND superfamily exporter protein
MFVGIAVTFAIVLIVLFVILIIYKRRRQASKLPVSVDRVVIDNQAAEEETESSPNHNQV